LLCLKKFFFKFLYKYLEVFNIMSTVFVSFLFLKVCTN